MVPDRVLALLCMQFEALRTIESLLHTPSWHRKIPTLIEAIPAITTMNLARLIDIINLQSSAFTRMMLCETGQVVQNCCCT